MTMADVVRTHQQRCTAQLARLRWSATDQAISAVSPSAVTRLVAEGISNILAEAKAAQRAALAPGQRGSGHSPLVRARLTRLEKSAHRAVAAACEGNAVSLRQELARFETFATAMWTVQLSACGHE